MAFSTPLYRDNPWLSSFVTVSILAGLLLRTFVTCRRTLMYQRDPARWLWLFTVSLPMFSVPVGLLYVWAVQRYGVDQWTFTAVLIWTSSIATAAPSLVCDALPAVTVPFFPNAAFSFASPSIVVCDRR